MLSFRHKTMMKEILKKAFLAVVFSFSPFLPKRASILMYHSIGENGAFFTVTQKKFERQLLYLQKKRFRILKLSELLSRLKRGKDTSRCVVLTFDDGYKDNYSVAFPLLKKFNFPATIFLATGKIGDVAAHHGGKTLPMLSLKEIEEMSESGLVEFMPHTENHVSLPAVSFEEAKREIEESATKVESITGKRARIFSYPKGKTTPEIAAYLKKNEWDGAVIVRGGLVSQKSDIFHLPRNSVDSTVSLFFFKVKVSPVAEFYQSLKSIFWKK